MKKYITIITLALFVCTITGCGSSESASTSAIRHSEVCGACKGTGYYKDFDGETDKRCHRCSGTGVYYY